MLKTFHYALRSKTDGQYLVAQVKDYTCETPQRYLLLFRADYDALSYLNTHAPDLASRFGVESVSDTQLKALLTRWGFEGLGLVQDPLEPAIQFLPINSQFNTL